MQRIKTYVLLRDQITGLSPSYVIEAGTHFTWDGYKYKDYRGYCFSEDVVKNTNFFKPVEESPAPKKYHLPVVTVSGVEYLNPDEVKGRMEDAFYMSRDKINIVSDDEYRFPDFESYWEYHSHNLLLSKKL